MISLHNHTDLSNLRLIDCVISVGELIETSAKLGYKGIAITDHETVAAHVQAIKKTKELKKKGTIPQDFKLILGNEIYLCDSMEVRDNYKSGETKFPHFLLISKNKEAHEALRILSSKAWEKSFFTGTMERVPTLKSEVEEVIEKYPNSLIASTACLGSESSIHLLAIKKYEEMGNVEKVNEHRQKLHEFIIWCISVFGKENFFVELQPSKSEEQRYVNEKLIPLADYYGLKRIITTDTHYLRPEDRELHKAFLNAKDGDREVDSFYFDTHLHTSEEIHEKLDYIDKEIIEDALRNTLLIGEMVEDYTIENETIIPKIRLPEFKVRHLFEPAYDNYEYIKNMVYSNNEQDRYMIKLIEDGFEEKIKSPQLTREYFHKVLDRINKELGELWEISLRLNQAMTSYYITVREIINIIWDDECGGNSLSGIGRGSSGGFLICGLLGITEFNPLEYDIELPHWRHIHKSRPDYPDIDIDFEGGKRQQILRALKKHFGEDRVLQICTYGTEGSKSALQTAARGLGIDSDTSLYLSGLIPFERGSNWSLRDCLYGNEEEDRKPVKEFIREIEKYPNLKETALRLEGKITKRSIHAGGVNVYNQPYYKTNAMMKAPNGTPVTQFNLKDSEAVGDMKLDCLTIEALDKIRATLDMLLENGEIEWKGSLRETFNYYFHPNKLEYNDPKLYEMIASGEVMDLFQFSTEIGVQTIKKVKPKNLIEIASANSLMRLMSEGEEQPIDTFIKYKNDINLWHEEMKRYGLTIEEINIMKEHLLQLNGVADTQESVMLLSMDERIAGFDVEWANKLRKSIAKKDKKVLDETKQYFFENGVKLGTSENLLKYVWDVQIYRQIGYSFSSIHSTLYSLIMFQELNLNYKFNPLYWATACLSVNAGSNDDSDDEDKKNKSTDYGKIAYAIGNIQKQGITVSLPDINKAGFGFKPDIENNAIIFGLKGINGCGDDLVQSIIHNRPYSSFNDFIERMFNTGLVKKSQMIQLIKAGCFESFGSRMDIMKQFIGIIYEPKQKLTMSNLKMLIENDLIPEELYIYIRYFKFKDYISKRVHKTVEKPKDKLLLLDDISAQFFNDQFTDESIVDYHNGSLIISEKQFKKEYDKKMQPIKDWIVTDEALNKINEKLRINEWKTYALGSVSKWEMASLSYYYSIHELSHMNKEKYGVVDFYNLPESPIPIAYNKRGQREFPIFDITRIAGTVLDKDKNKHTVTLLTLDGVVTVKLNDGQFSFYNKQISQRNGDKKEVLEKSWFQRGNMLLVCGYRRGNQFRAHKYKNSIYQHSVALIDHIDEEGNLTLTTERQR